MGKWKEHTVRDGGVTTITTDKSTASKLREQATKKGKPLSDYLREIANQPQTQPNHAIESRLKKYGVDELIITEVANKIGVLLDYAHLTREGEPNPEWVSAVENELNRRLEPIIISFKDAVTEAYKKVLQPAKGKKRGGQTQDATIHT